MNQQAPSLKNPKILSSFVLVLRYVPQIEEKIILLVFRTVVKPRLNLTRQDLMAIEDPRQWRQI